VEFAGLVHPLVASPVGNDGTWDRNTLVTGSNASGKSTFIKALAINAILAQTIHTSFAGRFRMCRARVMSSMAIRDDVQAGESYFVAEVRSLKRILDAAAGDMPVLAFIDEILRGTNTVERISASSAVLRRLEEGSALLMAATHDIELTRILPGCANVHFRETVDERGVTFDYRLRPGPSATRNAIALLQQLGFGDDIVCSAREMAARFEGEQKWPTL
jgi:DNA mismatch repair ATPase MutS